MKRAGMKHYNLPTKPLLYGRGSDWRFTHPAHPTNADNTAARPTNANPSSDRKGAVLRAAVFLLIVSSAFAQSMFRGDAAHSGVYAGAAPRTLHGVKWKFPTGGRVVASAVARDGVIYFGSDDGNLYAVDAVSGRQIWKFATAGPIPSTARRRRRRWCTSPASTASATPLTPNRAS